MVGFETLKPSSYLPALADSQVGHYPLLPRSTPVRSCSFFNLPCTQQPLSHTFLIRYTAVISLSTVSYLLLWLAISLFSPSVYNKGHGRTLKMIECY